MLVAKVAYCPSCVIRADFQHSRDVCSPPTREIRRAIFGQSSDFGPDVGFWDEALSSVITGEQTLAVHC